MSLSDFSSLPISNLVKKIIVEFRDVYGRELMYPINEAAKDLARLMNVKSFTRKQMEQAVKLGFEIEVQTAPPPSFDVKGKK